MCANADLSEGGRTLTLHVRKGWIFWQALNPDEALGMIDSHTVYRSRTREGAIDKARRAHTPSKPPEVVEVPLPEPK